MSTTRSYFCNLCHMAISDDSKGFGCYHVTKSITRTTLREAENHLCWQCAKAVAEIVERSGGAVR